jgi:hypothetical protein
VAQGRLVEVGFSAPEAPLRFEMKLARLTNR